MALSLILRIVAIALTTLGGAAGAIATHQQIKEGNEKRLAADEAARREPAEKES